MRKIFTIAILMSVIMSCSLIPAYSWTEYLNVRYMDFDGDFADEVIIECKHGVGIGHYIEDIRIFKDKDPELELIFTIETLDSHSGYISPNFPAQDVVSDVEFTEPTIENKGIRDIIVKSKKIYYKDEDSKIVDRIEDLGTKTFKWNGKAFVESKINNQK